MYFLSKWRLLNKATCSLINLSSSSSRSLIKQNGTDGLTVHSTDNENGEPYSNSTRDNLFGLVYLFNGISTPYELFNVKI